MGNRASKKLPQTTKEKNAFATITPNPQVLDILNRSGEFNSTQLLEQLANRCATKEEFFNLLRDLFLCHLIFDVEGDWGFIDGSERADSIVANALAGITACLKSQIASLHGYSRQLSVREHHKSNILSNNQLFTILAMSSASLAAGKDCTAPTRLYSLAAQGSSWERLMVGVDNYNGPVLLVVATKQQEILGAYVHSGLQDHGTKYFGTESTFLYRLTPDLLNLPGRIIMRGACSLLAAGSNLGAGNKCAIANFFSASGTGANYVLFNRASPFAVKGLAFGGDNEHFRLLIDSDMKDVRCCAACRTYKSGLLLHTTEDSFEASRPILDFEVWGLGSTINAADQEYKRNMNETLKADRRKLDMGKMLADDVGLLKKEAAGERQGEVDVIVEQRRKEKEEAKQSGAGTM